jgi:hypothetical protein
MKIKNKNTIIEPIFNYNLEEMFNAVNSRSYEKLPPIENENDLDLWLDT